MSFKSNYSTDLLPDSAGKDDYSLIDVVVELRALRQLLAGKTKPFLTVDEFAEIVGRDPYTVRTWIKLGKVAATRVQGTGPKGRLLIARTELDRVLRNGSGREIAASETFITLPN